MNDTDTSSSKKPETGWVPCQNCGKPILVILPFIGCVFCSECIKAGSAGSNVGTEHFTPNYVEGYYKSLNIDLSG